MRRSFFRIRDGREETLGELGLDPRRKTLLVTLGSEGIGAISTVRLLSSLVRRDLPLNVIVVTGKNARLKRQLEVEFGEAGGPRGSCRWASHAT